MIVTKVGGANMIAHAQWSRCPSFPRVAVFYVTPDQTAPLGSVRPWSTLANKHTEKKFML